MPAVFCILCDNKFVVKPYRFNMEAYVPICAVCRTNTPPEEHRCKGFSHTTGERCKHWTSIGSKTCVYHRGD